MLYKHFVEMLEYGRQAKKVYFVNATIVSFLDLNGSYVSKEDKTNNDR